MNVLYAGDIPPTNTASGAKVLYRHLQLLSQRHTVSVAHWTSGEIPRASWYNLASRRLTRRAFVSRRRRHFEALDGVVGIRVSDAELQRVVVAAKPDVIVTLAQGGLCHNAQRIASKHRIPLAVFFHDWSPDWRLNPTWSRPLLNWAFRRLARKCDLAWCISDQMRSAISPQKNAIVLPPIPEPKRTEISGEAPEQGREEVVYSGILNGYYETDIRRLAQSVPLEVLAGRFGFYGPNPHWADETGHGFLTRGPYRGFVPDLAPALANATALLVIMPFGREYRRFATLSFPSKLVEYCAVGRPIVVWGPVYASAVQWALRTGAAVTVTDSDPRALLARLDALRSNPGERRELARRARGHYDVQFRPDIIQRQFEDSLMSLLDKHTAMRA